MDPRSASALDDPSGALDLLRARRSIALPNVDAARERTASELSRVREQLAEIPAQDGVSTCVFGSWGRGELTEGSDDDWAVLVRDDFTTYERRVTLEFVAASGHLGDEDHKPGTQSIFGVPFAVEDLVRNIGLDRDTNTNLTRRMLLLLESRELHGAVRDEAITRILGRYLNEGVKPRRVPRFLLNDLVRYWRTICVDFEGKAAADDRATDPKWATRNAKLRTSRKLLFVGGLVSVLLCQQAADLEEMQAFLTRWFDAPPLDRLAGAFLYAAEAEPEMLDPAVRTFAAYDRWLALISDGAVREALLDITPGGRDASPLFQTIREIGEEFESGLLSLLFSSAFAEMTRSNAIF